MSPTIRPTADPTRVGKGPRPPLWRDLIPFGVLAFGLSWIPWTVLGVLHADIDEGVGALVFAFAATGPSWAALAMRIAGHRRPTEFRTRASWAWPVAAIVLAGSPAVVGAILEHVGDLEILPRHAASTIASVGGPLGALAYTFISGPLSEEFGWRGFMQPRLRRTLRPITTVTVIGAVWGTWHLPLFLLDGTGQHDDGLVSLAGVLFLLTLFPLSYLILFASERLAGGVWAAILAHAAFNLSDALAPDPGKTALVTKTVAFLLLAGISRQLWRRAASDTGDTRSMGQLPLPGKVDLADDEEGAPLGVGASPSDRRAQRRKR